MDVIKGLHEGRGLTIILVSHSMEDVARYAERLIVMNHGSKMFDGTPREVFRHYKELEAIGLAAPQITYLIHDLRERGAALDPDITTIREAREAILQLWAEEKGRGQTCLERLHWDNIIRWIPKSIGWIRGRSFFGTMIFIISLFIADNLWGYGLAAAALILVIRMTCVPVRFILRGLRAVLILLLISVSFNLFLTGGRVIAQLWIFKITAEGVRLAVFMAVRLIFSGYRLVAYDPHHDSQSADGWLGEGPGI